mmetsp:Transcript_1668/g.4457  ORF Transcript_1668/g.4457 Transcript_1668/m.4457 type:complete len:278 (-) Transcript_1668:147-980(-)
MKFTFDPTRTDRATSATGSPAPKVAWKRASEAVCATLSRCVKTVLPFWKWLEQPSSNTRYSRSVPGWRNLFVSSFATHSSASAGPDWPLTRMASARRWFVQRKMFLQARRRSEVRINFSLSSSTSSNVLAAPHSATASAARDVVASASTSFKSTIPPRATSLSSLIPDSLPDDNSLFPENRGGLDKTVCTRCPCNVSTATASLANESSFGSDTNEKEGIFATNSLSIAPFHCCRRFESGRASTFDGASILDETSCPPRTGISPRAESNVSAGSIIAR